jgi:predicted anti-sigma-YlaC factor YlaD
MSGVGKLAGHLPDEQLQALAEADQALVTIPAHLGTCGACRDAVAVYHRIGRELAAAPNPLPPADFTASLMARLPDEPPPLSTDDFLAASVAAAAALVAGFLFLRADGLPQLIDLLRHFPGRAVTEGLLAACLSARDQVAVLLFLAAAALILGFALRRVLAHPRRMLA